jgi:hypothetical protein
MSSELAPVPKALVIITVCLLQSDRFRAQITGWVRHGAKLVPADGRS